MPEDEPSTINPAIQEVMDKALVPMFGENLPLYYAAVERHQGDARELIDRARRVTQELISAALDRLTFFGGDRLALLGDAHEHTKAQRAELDKELHEALVAERQRFEDRVKALRIEEEE